MTKVSENELIFTQTNTKRKKILICENRLVMLDNKSSTNCEVKIISNNLIFFVIFILLQR